MRSTLREVKVPLTASVAHSMMKRPCSPGLFHWAFFTFAPNNQSDSISGFTEDPKYHGSFETRFSRDRDSSRGHVGIFKTVFSNKVLKEEMLVSTDGEEAERLMSLTQVESLVYCVINNVVCVLIPEFSSFM